MNPFDVVLIESVARVLSDTDEGLTNTETGRLLAQLAINDPLVAAEARAKARVLRAAEQEGPDQRGAHRPQRKTGAGDGLGRFIEAAMRPCRT